MAELTNEEIVNRFRAKHDLLQRLVDEAIFAIENYLGEANIKGFDISGRVKPVKSFSDKIARKRYSDPINDIEDQAGLRVVCLYSSDVSRIAEAISSKLKVISEENKSAELGFEKMGYQGIHLICTLMDDLAGPRYVNLVGVKFEIQIRTILQDSWSRISHNLVYKSEDSTPLPLRRNLNNVSALLEVAQGVFDQLEILQTDYASEIRMHGEAAPAVELLPIDHETVALYIDNTFPDFASSHEEIEEVMTNLNKKRFSSIADLEHVYQRGHASLAGWLHSRRPRTYSGARQLALLIGASDQEFQAEYPFSLAEIEAMKQLMRND